MKKLTIKFSEDEIKMIDKRIEDGWAVSRPEVLRQAVLCLYLRRRWLGERKFRAEMMKTRKKLEKLKS